MDRSPRIVMTSFGFNDSGGGTLVPRLVSKELVRRGWEVTVFHAAVESTGGKPYAVREWVEDGVRLVGVHNRPHGLFDLGNPRREIDDPPITAAFARLLDETRPDVVHFHNLHNLGAALLDEAAARAIPSYFTTHNHWLICPRAYLLRGDGTLCPGPGGRGADCAGCVGSQDKLGYEQRLDEIRAKMSRAVSTVLAVSEPVKRTLVAQGYAEDAIDVVRQALPAAEGIWEELGRDRRPGRREGPLTVGFFGSAYGFKGPHLLVEAAQRVESDIRVRICGKVPPKFAAPLRAIDRRGVVEATGPYTHAELPSLLAEVDVAALPSMVWDCAPLTAAECLAGRVPVVAPRMAGLAEAIRHDVDGLAFDGHDVDDLARQLERLASEEGLVERLQANIEAPRTFADHVDELEAYYAGERPSRSEPDPAPPAVRWVGDHMRSTSLSIVNRRVVERLDLPLQRVARDGQPLDAPLAHGAEVEVRHQWPPDLRPAPSGRLAVIQPWEFGSVPSAWVEQIEANVDELWVPSELVRSMYVESGVAAERVRVIPNGVDLEVFRPEGERLPLDARGTRFLFVGGLVPRKGPDVLLHAWLEAFEGRDDVTLVVKDFGAGGVYRRGDREAVRAHAESGELPRVVLLGDELETDQMAALYRACDVLVHPYRGEGFGMPVLEAMACGLPVVVTAGGPTDEFCPDDACWRIPAARRPFPERRVGDFETAGVPWLLEPDAGALAALLREVADDADGRAARGAAAAVAARELSWDAIAERYRARIEALRGAAGAPALAVAPAPAFEPDEDAAVRVLAAPAWRAENPGLAELLAAWREAAPAGTDACLYLLVGSRADGDPEKLLRLTAETAERAGIDLDGAADVTLLAPPDRDRDLHAAMDAYVALPGAAPGHARAASVVLEPDAAALGRVLAAARQPRAA